MPHSLSLASRSPPNGSCLARLPTGLDGARLAAATTPQHPALVQPTPPRYRTINLLSIGSCLRTRLRPDYPAAVHPCGRTLRRSVAMIATSLLRYSFRHSHSSALHRRFRADFAALTTLPYRWFAPTRSFGASLCPGTASAQRCLTSELLRTLSRMAASKPTSWLSERRHNLSH